jgi:acyl-CoA synthetase (AMP-forming)/AMP-acid ligase II
MDLRPNTLYDLLLHQGNSRPEQTAIISASGNISYMDLLEEVEVRAYQLQSLGVKRGDRVGIHLRKSPEEVIATFAIASLGAVFVNINYQWTSLQLQHVISDCAISVLVTDSRKIRELTGILRDDLLQSVIATDLNEPYDKVEAWTSCISTHENWRNYNPISSDLAALLYTSGSTGTPKGVMVTHRNILDGAHVVGEYLGLMSSDRLLSVPPFNFDYGLNQLIASVTVGATLVLQGTTLPVEILKSVQTHEATVLPLVAPSWVQVLRVLLDDTMPLPSLRIATNTGGKIPKNLLIRVTELLPDVSFFLMYGLTEAFRSTYLPPALFKEKLGAIGIAVPDNEIFVVDQDNGICGPDEIGELIHRGSFVSRGYWGKPELTDDRIKPNKHLRDIIGDEPVVHSGDLVSIDKDGICWFIGRYDEMIKCSGFRMSPTEIEDIVYTIDNVEEAVAFGVHDEEMGQVVHLIVYVDQKIEFEKTLLKSCRQLMPSYMVPKKIIISDQPMPRTANDKLDRPSIIKKHLEQT